MYERIRVSSFIVASFLIVAAAQARQWTDASGKYSIEADLFGFDDENVVLQRGDQELGALDIDMLSEKDREYLESRAAQEIHNRNINPVQTWTTTSGLQLVGRLVDYARGDVTIQRRRGRMYVNHRAFANLPEIYRELLPSVIEHFEEIEIPDQRAMQNWLLTLRGQPRVFQLEGVILEMESGDEYAIPFFVLSEPDRNLLKAGWAEWLAVQNDHDQRDDYAFRLQALAAAQSQHQRIDRQIAEMTLKLQAVRAGLTSLWEVTLYPVPGNPRPPQWVVVPGRDSAQATATALQNNPGFVDGPVRRVSR